VEGEMIKYISKSKDYIAGFSHVLVMFISVIMVPQLIGFDPTLALLTAGIGTLFFYFIAKKQVPIFLGSSFAFIGVLEFINKSQGVGYAKGAVIVIGLVYIALSYIIKIYGVEKLRSLFPTIVTSPLIMVMGLKLCQWGVTMMTYQHLNDPLPYEVADGIVSAIVIFTMIVIFTFSKGLFSLFAIIISLSLGIITSLFIKGSFDLTAVHEAKWVGFSENALNFMETRPNINIQSLLVVIPITLFVIFEHVGDIAVLNSVTKRESLHSPQDKTKDFFLSPGLDKTLLGNGVATVFAGILGGPVNTTYSENAATLEITKVSHPKAIAFASIFTIALAFFGKFTALLMSIPSNITGALSLTLYALITACGLRSFVTTRVDFNFKRNMIICASILVFGMVVDSIKVYQTIQIPGIAIACIIGILLNKFLPEFK